MADNILDTEVAEIHQLGTRVQGYAEAVRKLTVPNLSGTCSNAQGSDIAAACNGRSDTISEQRDKVAGRMEQFKDLCGGAGKGYADTEEEIASGFSVMGQA